MATSETNGLSETAILLGLLMFFICTIVCTICGVLVYRSEMTRLEAFKAMSGSEIERQIALVRYRIKLVKQPQTV